MKKIEDNDALFKKLGDRKYMEAVNRFQADPAGAMEQYKDDREIQEFLTTFCKIMGTTIGGRGLYQRKGGGGGGDKIMHGYFNGGRRESLE